MGKFLKSEVLSGLPHGFSTRDNGGTPDGLGDAPVIRLKQVHSPDVIVVDGASPWPDDARPEADALVTKRRGVFLAIVTADCAPVLFADHEAGVVGAAHAGWRGAAGGVIAHTVEAMVALGARPENIAAAIGPCIAQASYEVDAPFRSNFGPADDSFFAAGTADRWQFDLPGYVAGRLRQAGVGRIDDLALDTYSGEAEFYSFRRATHRAEPTEGRQISMIGLPER